MGERPSLRECLEYLYPDQGTHSWKISFDEGPGVEICRHLHEKCDDCDWEYIRLADIERAERALVEQDRGFHMAHCFQGENEGSCKYGDDDCPAGVGYVDPKAPPMLGGGLTPVRWLRSSAEMDRKNKANARAREADLIADWLEGMFGEETAGLGPPMNAEQWSATMAGKLQDIHDKMQAFLDAGPDYDGWWQHTDSHFWTWLADQRVNPNTILALRRGVDLVTQTEIDNELGNRIKITIEGPTSVSENVLTIEEAKALRKTLNEHFKD